MDGIYIDEERLEDFGVSTARLLHPGTYVRGTEAAALPVMAMRSGQRTCPFFMPEAGMAAMTISCSVPSVQSVISSRIGCTNSSACFAISGVVLLFLFT